MLELEKDIIDYVLFTQEQLEVKIKELSIWVNKTYKNSKI